MKARTIQPMLLGLALLLGLPLAMGQPPAGLRLAPQNPTQGEGLGYAVAMADATLAVSTRFTQSIYLFSYDGTAWQEVQKITGPQGSLNRTHSKSLGEVMAMHGNRLLVAAPQGGTDEASKTGLIEVFRQGEQGWQMETILYAPEPIAGARLGSAVDLNEAWIIAGAPKLRYETGGAYLFHHTPEGWQTQTLENPDARATYCFGEAVAIGERFAVVGAPGYEAKGQQTGALYFYEMRPEGWQLVQTLNADPAYQSLGQSLDMRGDRLVVGAYGQVMVWERHIEQWEVVATLTNPEAGSANSFGSSLRLSPDGDKLIVGARNSAYLYCLNNGEWQMATAITNEATAFASHNAINDQTFILNSPYEGEVYIDGAIYCYDIAPYLQALIR